MRGTITVVGEAAAARQDKKLIFKNCVPFTG